ncbi:uridine kinase family protein [Jeotgalibacillus campisalis]|uniref:Phosphoribulokinase n=1 Tax=Jeotgalibacillus campisalis TaxID=220754 RepID=A0A0C2QYH5_9BACL|nr:phosphoribulokinase [Jeotgalibacillus campisalis]KIL43080.1 phosphoribulokinase [Jeotgalibacillus campisalis]
MIDLVQKTADLLKSTNRKMMIGISGHGAAGKSTFTHQLMNHLPQDEVNYVNTDPYIIGSSLRQYTTLNYLHQNIEHQSKVTACHPAAHNVFALERDIKMLRDGLDLYTIGTDYMESVLLSLRKITIIEGMTTAFVDPELFDLTLFFYTDGETELVRRGIRDVTERGADLSYLQQSHEQRRMQYDLFMHPYRANFDIVIKNSNDHYSLEKGIEKLNTQKP